MGQQRTDVTESLLARQGHDNLVYSEENGGIGVGDGGSLAASTVTTTLVLSTFVAACIAFGFGCAVSAFLLNVFLQFKSVWDSPRAELVFFFAARIFIPYSVFNHGRLGTFCG